MPQVFTMPQPLSENATVRNGVAVALFVTAGFASSELLHRLAVLTKKQVELFLAF
jgi:hypothetical protein